MKQRRYKMKIEQGGRRVELSTGWPVDCVGLPSAPNELEPALRAGYWLVFVFAEWSAGDVASIESLYHFARSTGRRPRIGVREFSDSREILAWAPTIVDKHQFGSPIWMVIDHGVIVATRVGPLSRTKLAQWVEESDRRRI